MFVIDWIWEPALKLAQALNLYGYDARTSVPHLQDAFLSQARLKATTHHFAYFRDDLPIRELNKLIRDQKWFDAQPELIAKEQALNSWLSMRELENEQAHSQYPDDEASDF